MNNSVMFASNSDEWATPQAFYDEINREFGFNLDPCATDANHKCSEYYTKEQNGLEKSWGGRCVFCNPPYSQSAAWVRKCYEEGHKDNTVVVCLIPARTDTRYFHEYIYHRAEVRFIRGRLKFGDSKTAAPFPSMLVIWRGPDAKKEAK